MIAFVGSDLPQDLLRATGRDAGPLGWDIDRATPQADRWLESKFPLWTRSILQDWADGAFDHLEAVIFSRADDSAQRLYYYVCELQRQGQIKGPAPLILDVAKIARASSEIHVAWAIRALAGRLGIDDAALETAISQVNRIRRMPIGPAAHAQPVCLLAGSAPPDRRLHDMVETLGWRPVGDTLLDTWQALGPLVDEASADPFAALARQLHPRPHGSRSFFDRGDDIVRTAIANGASAVLLWFAGEEEAQVWHLPSQRRALQAANIPALSLTRRDWRGRDGVDREIGAFLQEIAA